MKSFQEDEKASYEFRAILVSLLGFRNFKEIETLELKRKTKQRLLTLS